MAAPRHERLLTLDLGNTTLDVSCGSTRRRLDPGDLRALEALCGGQLDEAVSCTVVRGGLDRVAALLARRGIPLAIAGEELACPLDLRYAVPGTLGVDRWVAALAAHRRFGDAVVADCGTALTVDVVTAEGVFLGGAIAPGAQALAAGLRVCAPGLPAAELDGALTAIPARTQDALRAGVRLGFCGLLERLVDELAGAAGLAEAARVITGGEAELYLAHGRIPFAHVPDLVHEGLRVLAGSRAAP